MSKLLYASEATIADGPEEAYELEAKWDIESDLDKELIAMKAAEDYFSEHDGWEDSWPQMFYFWDEDHNELFEASVGMEAQPAFSARLSKTETQEEGEG